MKQKVKMYKWVKGILLGVGGILSLIGIFLIYKECTSNRVLEEKNIIYEYKDEVSSTYKVRLLENLIYDEMELGEGQNYLSKIIKDINVEFSSDFSGSEEAAIEGEYSIKGRIEGYKIEDKQKQVIWTKNYDLLPQKTFKTKGNQHQIKESINVQYPFYDNLASQIKEQTGANLSMQFVINMTGTKRIQVHNKTVEVPLNTEIIIPLNAPYFVISKSGGGEVANELTEVLTKEVPINVPMIVAYGIISVLGLMMLGFVLIGTTDFTGEDLRRKKIKKIYTNHGSRMVGIEKMKEEKFKIVYYLKGIEDLVKVADELDKPVMYIYGEMVEYADEFYVVDGDVVYIYIVPTVEVAEVVREEVVDTVINQD